MLKVFTRNHFHLLLPSGSEDLVPLAPRCCFKVQIRARLQGPGLMGPPSPGPCRVTHSASPGLQF